MDGLLVGFAGDDQRPDEMRHFALLAICLEHVDVVEDVESLPFLVAPVGVVEDVVHFDLEAENVESVDLEADGWKGLEVEWAMEDIVAESTLAHPAIAEDGHMECDLMPMALHSS